MTEIQIKGIQERSFASIWVLVDIPQINVPLSRHRSNKQNRKRANNLTKRKGSLMQWYRNRSGKLQTRKKGSILMN